MRLVCRNEQAEIAGILPLQHTRGLPLGFGGALAEKRLSSLPRTPVGGPVAVNDIAEALLVEKAIELGSQNDGCLLQIKSYNSNLHQKSSGLSRFFWRDFFAVKIPPHPADIQFGNSRNHSAIKRAIRKAIRGGVSVTGQTVQRGRGHALQRILARQDRARQSVITKHSARRGEQACEKVWKGKDRG